MIYANLHMHSIYSDGIHTPQELCALAVQKGYRAVALTDHETTRGVSAMREAAAGAGLEFLTGIEMVANGCGLEKGSFHIVGLDFDPEHPRMKAYTAWTERNAAELCRRRLEHCQRTGAFGTLSWQEVTERFPDVGWYCNEQVFKLLQEKYGVTDPEYWTFFRQFNGAPVQGVSNLLDAAEVIDIIRAAGGVAVLAHPHEQTQYLPALKACGLGGVEVNHPDLTPDDEREALRLADTLGLYRSGGTDHTGVLGNNMKRGNAPVHKPLVPFDADVINGVDQAAFKALQQRVLG